MKALRTSLFIVLHSPLEGKTDFDQKFAGHPVIWQTCKQTDWKMFGSHCNALRNQCVAMFGQQQQQQQQQQKHTHTTFAIAVCSVLTRTSSFTQFVPSETLVISFWYGR